MNRANVPTAALRIWSYSSDTAIWLLGTLKLRMSASEPEQTPQFADLYAQTLTYGLFAARCHHDQYGTGEFRLNEAARDIPRTNPLLRQLFNTITGPDFEAEPYAGFVDELVAILNRADIREILADFGRAAARQDPVLHFYETFLATYDPKLRESRGVYYTPEPVVSYIVRSVDELLRSRFDIADGLADAAQVTYEYDAGQTTEGVMERSQAESHRTLILDPAAGTGTFLYEVIELIRERIRTTGRAGTWGQYVHEHLLPRLFAFELLMAPYAVAHLKLGMQLAAQDLPEEERAAFSYDFAADERLQVYLTNTLEQVELHTQQMLGPLHRAIATEAREAARAKRDLPILVVLGNPPYSGQSSNKVPWISDLLKGRLPNGRATASYFHVDGEPLGERNPKWLQDDYVKFIRWAQWRLERTGHGILAFITNNGYLDNPTFRGMRRALMQAFDEIYIVDLHGNSAKRETAPDQSLDENVFDIQGVGVAIGIFVRTRSNASPREPVRIHHADLWGARSEKYSWLELHSTEVTQWRDLEPTDPLYLFRYIDPQQFRDYGQWPSLTSVIPSPLLALSLPAMR